MSKSIIIIKISQCIAQMCATHQVYIPSLSEILNTRKILLKVTNNINYPNLDFKRVILILFIEKMFDLSSNIQHSINVDI